MATDLLSRICDEIDERLGEMGPLLAEYQQLLVASGALVATGQNGSSLQRGRSESVGVADRRKVAKVRSTKVRSTKASGAPTKPKAERAARGAAREAILAALEHGSHTVGELVVVTAMGAPNVNGNLRKLASEGAVRKTEREGKAAWARTDVLASTA